LAEGLKKNLKPVKYKFLVLCISLGWTIFSCFSDAPHDNPLDASHGLSSHSIGGSVHTYYPHPPRSIIAGAEVCLWPQRIITTTNADGTFRFNELESGKYKVVCTKPGFSSDSIEIDIPIASTMDFFLDGLPYFQEFKITTHHISQWFPAEDSYYLEIEVTASDSDGVEELDIAWMDIPEMGISDTLQESSTAGLFTHTIIPQEVSNRFIHSFVGKEFYFYLRDNFGSQIVSPPKFITRIVENVPVLDFPIQWDTVSEFPFDFTWQAIYLPFPFSLRLELFRIFSGFNAQVDEISDIPGNSSSYSYNKTLEAGDYFWVLYIVDEFGNCSRSKEGSFQVE
jgi:hypothetical protein